MPPAVALIVFGLPLLVGMRALLAGRQSLSVAIVLVYLGAMLLLRPLVARYFLAVGPLLWVCFAEGVRRLVGAWPRWRQAAPRVATVCLIVLAGVNLAKDCKAVYRAHDQQFPPKKQFYLQTAAVLRQHSDDGRFLGGGQAANILARLSGVPYRDLYAVFGMRKPSAEEVFRKLDETDVRLVVVWPAEAGRPYEKVLAEAIEDRPDFQLIARNEIIAVYRKGKP